MSFEAPELDHAEIRQFGLILAGALVMLFGLFLPWLWGQENVPNWYWTGAGVVAALWALIAPSTMNAFYRAWLRITMVIGNGVNRIILGIVFFFVITPMAVVMKVLGKDPMQRTLDRQASSYRKLRSASARIHMENPY